MNPYAEAIAALFSGKSFKPVLIRIAQNNPGVLVKAFKACYPPDQAGPLEKTMDAPKFDAVIAMAEADAAILSLARSYKIEAIKMYREIHKSGLKEAKEAVEKMLAEDNGNA